MGQEPGAPINTADPSIARIYDWLLGGKNNFEADREFGAQLVRDFPDVRRMAGENRTFVSAATGWAARRWAADGVTGCLFLDVGAGLPPPAPYEAVHVTVRKSLPAASIVYVDNDPGVLSYIQLLEALPGNGVTVIVGDLDDPQSVLGHPAVREHAASGEPGCVILAAILHFLPPERAAEVVAELMASFPSGSAAVISTARYGGEELAARVSAGIQGSGSFRGHGPEDVAGFFAAAGLEVAGPGIGDVRAWSGPAEMEPCDAYMLGGAGIKP